MRCHPRGGAPVALSLAIAAGGVATYFVAKELRGGETPLKPLRRLVSRLVDRLGARIGSLCIRNANDGPTEALQENSASTDEEIFLGSPRDEACPTPECTTLARYYCLQSTWVPPSIIISAQNENLSKKALFTTTTTTTTTIAASTISIHVQAYLPPSADDEEDQIAAEVVDDTFSPPQSPTAIPPTTQTSVGEAPASIPLPEGAVEEPSLPPSPQEAMEYEAFVVAPIYDPPLLPTPAPCAWLSNYVLDCPWNITDLVNVYAWWMSHLQQLSERRFTSHASMDTVLGQGWSENAPLMAYYRANVDAAAVAHLVELYNACQQAISFVTFLLCCRPIPLSWEGNVPVPEGVDLQTALSAFQRPGKDLAAAALELSQQMSSWTWALGQGVMTVEETSQCVAANEWWMQIANGVWRGPGEVAPEVLAVRVLHVPYYGWYCSDHLNVDWVRDTLPVHTQVQDNGMGGALEGHVRNHLLRQEWVVLHEEAAPPAASAQQPQQAQHEETMPETVDDTVYHFAAGTPMAVDEEYWGPEAPGTEAAAIAQAAEAVEAPFLPDFKPSAAFTGAAGQDDGYEYEVNMDLGFL